MSALFANSPVVFLDFDGVLSKGMTGGFQRLPLFEGWLRRCTPVQVVISSSWRLDIGLDDLRAHFSGDLRSRVIGVTPEVQVGLHRRQAEILLWRWQTGHLGQFVALDDSPDEFEAGWPRLVVTPRHGVAEQHLQQCESLLRTTLPW